MSKVGHPWFTSFCGVEDEKRTLDIPRKRSRIQQRTQKYPTRLVPPGSAAQLVQRLSTRGYRSSVGPHLPPSNLCALVYLLATGSSHQLRYLQAALPLGGLLGACDPNAQGSALALQSGLLCGLVVAYSTVQGGWQKPVSR